MRVGSLITWSNQSISAGASVPFTFDAVVQETGDYENLAEITPPSMGFQVLTPSPIAMKEGAFANCSGYVESAVRILDDLLAG